VGLIDCLDVEEKSIGFAGTGTLTSRSTVHLKTELSSVVCVRNRTIPIERPPLVGEVNAYFCI
jgi:hypothetical protein